MSFFDLHGLPSLRKRTMPQKIHLKTIPMYLTDMNFESNMDYQGLINWSNCGMKRRAIKRLSMYPMLLGVQLLIQMLVYHIRYFYYLSVLKSSSTNGKNLETAFNNYHFSDAAQIIGMQPMKVKMPKMQTYEKKAQITNESKALTTSIFHVTQTFLLLKMTLKKFTPLEKILL